MDYKVRTPYFPSYEKASAFLRAVGGQKTSSIRAMISAIREQTGTPQNPVDWSDPDTWIRERLDGANAELAWSIWKQDESVLNPRHSYGPYLLAKNHDLCVEDLDGVWRITSRGEAFLHGQAAVLREIDEEEGLLHLLTIVSAHDAAKRADLLPEWAAYLHSVSTFSSDSSCKATLHQRLSNLFKRGLIAREGNTYTISLAGRDWLESASPKSKSPKLDLIEAVKQYNEAQKTSFHAQLCSMDPYRFERLVGSLLESMGYDDVEVTKQSGDKGVDVVGSVQVGITTVREVVQVKRTQASVGRQVVDQLRGALPYHQAIQGTLITLGKFAASCKDAARFVGAAPITLIDGETFIDLLVDYGVGLIRAKPIELLDIDTSMFEEPEL